MCMRLNFCKLILKIKILYKNFNFYYDFDSMMLLFICVWELKKKEENLLIY